jgi:cell division septal protein FtsQ
MKVIRKKRRFNIVKLLLALIVLYITGYFIYNLAMIPIKHIRILNTTYLSDQEILNTTKIDNYPSFFLTTSSSIKKKLKTIPYVKNVKVSKKWFCRLYLYIDEYKRLFYDTSSSKVVLENNVLVSSNDTNNLPKLINYVPDITFDELVEQMTKIDDNILLKISEIEYRPNEVDKERFLLTMNDGNYVYLTLFTFSKINEYMDILPTLENQKGILYLDSGNYFEIIN